MVIKIPLGISSDIATIVPCSGITAYNAILRVRSHLEHNIKITGKSLVLKNRLSVYISYCFVNYVDSFTGPAQKYFYTKRGTMARFISV